MGKNRIFPVAQKDLLLSLFSGTIFEQNLKTFGECQNRQNLTFKWLYQLYKSKNEKKKFFSMSCFIQNSKKPKKNHCNPRKKT